jgi:hypothetical protein
MTLERADCLEVEASNRLPFLAAEINRTHQQAHEAEQNALARAIECGRLLQEAQDAVGHGRWLAWIKQNLTFGGRQAQKYLRLASRRAELSNANLGSHLTINDALASLTAAPPEPVTKGGRITVREGTTLSALIREGMDEGLSSRPAARRAGIGADAWSQGRDVVLLADRADLGPHDKAVARKALKLMDETRQTKAAHQTIAHLVRRLWGGGHGSTRSAADEQRQIENFERAIAVIAAACSAEVVIPFLDKARMSLLTEEIAASRKALQRLEHRLRKEARKR